ncbi:unnamed protein product [Prorocentrum cordatum]|uniref:Uncharacterized protein n=1 Tax=Prorocentrum cordatum TaxID=2364126 RepID=A0ABN9WJU2_9DINO|nr:unnamed protein product [Polarella glacialis]
MALRYGLPIIASETAVDGMHMVPEEGYLPASSAEQYRRQMRRLESDEQLWQRLRTSGLGIMRTYPRRRPEDAAARLRRAGAWARRPRGDRGLPTAADARRSACGGPGAEEGYPLRGLHLVVPATCLCVC